MEFEASLRRRIVEMEAINWHFELAYNALIKQSGLPIDEIMNNPALNCCNYRGQYRHFQLEQNVVDTAFKLVDGYLGEGVSIEQAKMHLIMAVSNLRRQRCAENALYERPAPRVPEPPEKKDASGT